MARGTLFLLLQVRKLRPQGKDGSAQPHPCQLSWSWAWPLLSLSCLLSFKGVFDSLSAEPGWTHSFSIPPPPRLQPQGLCLGEFGRDYNLEILVTGLELCSLHLENKVVQRVQFWCPCGLGIYFSAILVCKNQASDSMINSRFLVWDCHHSHSFSVSTYFCLPKGFQAASIRSLTG